MTDSRVSLKEGIATRRGDDSGAQGEGKNLQSFQTPVTYF